MTLLRQSSALDGLFSSETLVSIYQTWNYIPEDGNLLYIYSTILNAVYEEIESSCLKLKNLFYGLGSKTNNWQHLISRFKLFHNSEWMIDMDDGRHNSI